MSKLNKLIISLLSSFAAGGVGGIATSSNIPTWYAALEKPFFNPPNWIFGPVWSILYLLIGISLYLTWIAPHKNSKKQAFIAFGVQLVLNALWSFVFFGLHLPWMGVVIIIALLASIIVTIRSFYPISRQAAYLLVPYLLWVSFATILNIAIASLN